MSLIFKGRLVLSGPREMDVAPELEKYIVGGSLICMKGQPVTKGDGWEMVECEVIIKPTKWRRKPSKDYLKLAKLDQVVMTVGDDSAWTDEEVPEKDFWEDFMG
jgi:hypothetical protein|tara:strand:+ start:11 stop:322 length:312 start_codon:yes stop_codon:yes gene_type:complete